jgi:perosamine synthetase
VSVQNFCACPGQGYSPADMLAGWLYSFGRPPDWLRSPEGQTVLTHQCRTALGLLCTLLGLGRGDEVLLPAYNCGAEVDPFVHAGCRVILYRIDRAAKIDVADIRRRMSPATRLVYITHFFGWPQDISGLAEVCRKREVFLVEDCAQALFSSGPNNRIGAHGDAVVYSFVKSLALPDGGALMLKSRPAAAVQGLRLPAVRSTFKASLPLFKKWFMQNHTLWQRRGWTRRWLTRSWSPRHQARSAKGRREMLASNRFPEAQRHWGMSRVSLGLLKQANAEWVASRRRRNFAFLHERLNNSKHLQPLYESLPDEVCPLAYPVFAQDAAKARTYFDQHGILVQGWPGYYPGMPWDEYPDACELKDDLLTLPVHQDLGLAQMDYIARCANRLGRESLITLPAEPIMPPDVVPK